MSKYINLIEKLYNSNIIDINHLSRYRKKYEKSNLDERKHLDATCDEIFKADINKLTPTYPSKLEERRGKIEGNNKKTKHIARYVFGGLIIIIGISIFIERAFRPSACECAKLITKNGFITYGDLQSMKDFSDTKGWVYKEMEKTYNCHEWYDYDDLKNCKN